MIATDAASGEPPPRAGEPIDLGTTGDGSPVAVYLAAPPGDTAAVVASVRPPPARVLELGAGAGRETRPLVASGYDVTAVDDSRDMLAHVTGARTVHGDLFALDLAERFDVVVAGSHLIDDADPGRRDRLLSVCSRHLARDGAVLVERYDPSWTSSPTSYAGAVGQVDIDFEVLGPDAAADDADPDVIPARLRYTLLDRVWVQEFRFVRVTERLLAVEAAAHGLTVAAVLGEDRTWICLRPAVT